MDPTAGDLPDNNEHHDVIANVLGAPMNEKAQEAMIK